MAVLIYGGAGGIDAVGLREVQASLTARDAAAAPRQTDLLASLLSALGEPVKDVDLAPLVQSTHQAIFPNGALWLDQEQAATAGRVGETVLTTILIASVGDHLSAEASVVARAVAGLKAIGLDADARALALEAALAAGI
jgi:hypothetical protein